MKLKFKLKLNETKVKSEMIKYTVVPPVCILYKCHHFQDFLSLRNPLLRFELKICLC